MESLRQLAMFPFLRSSGPYLREAEIDLGEVMSDMAYERARVKGRDRLMGAVKEGFIPSNPLGSEQDALMELLTYPIARIIASCTGDDFVIKRYALAEAHRARDLLEDSPTDTLSLISRELGLNWKQENSSFTVDFIDYLKFTSALRSKETQLIGQELDNGRVRVDRPRLTRMLQEALRMRIERELPLPVSQELLDTFKPHIQSVKEAADEHKEKFKAQDLGRASVFRFPPCMKQLLARTQKGENLPHSGRFAIAAFLNNIGLDEDGIMRVFGLSPDFKMDLAKYQIEHITGKISGTEYTAPGCAALKSYGLCPGEDSLCKRDWMNHPLTYYRVKGKKRKKPEKKEEEN